MVAAACLISVLPMQALAAPPQISTPWPAAVQPEIKIGDAALLPGGVLRGDVVDAEGEYSAGTEVSLRQHGKVLATTKCNQNGRFEFGHLAGGTYSLQAGENISTFRLWAPETAPPAAAARILLVSETVVTRGQQRQQRRRRGPVLRVLTNPWVMAGLLAAAITIPIAASNHDRRPAS